MIVIKSYCLAQVKGVKQALHLLEPLNGALVNAAKAQYEQSVENYQMAG